MEVFRESFLESFWLESFWALTNGGLGVGLSDYNVTSLWSQILPNIFCYLNKTYHVLFIWLQVFKVTDTSPVMNTSQSHVLLNFLLKRLRGSITNILWQSSSFAYFNLNDLFMYNVYNGVHVYHFYHKITSLINRPSNDKTSPSTLIKHWFFWPDL